MMFGRNSMFVHIVVIRLIKPCAFASRSRFLRDVLRPSSGLSSLSETVIQSYHTPQRHNRENTKKLIFTGVKTSELLLINVTS